MAVKEFFKPTKWKITTALIIFILPFVLFFILVFLNGGIEGDNSRIVRYIFETGLFSIGETIFFPYSIFKSFLTALMVSLPYSYLLSCIIIFIYNKIKKTKNAKKKKS